jgi:alcohol dehydrogenase (cytochrome c)
MATVYAATTNPAPDFAGGVREGSNRYTNSVLAIDAGTGALRWVRQLVPHDTHDWDLTHAGPLAGDSGVVATGTDGIVRLLNRNDGRVLWSTPVSIQRNTTAPITHDGVDVCPGVFGGVLWNGPAFDQRTGFVFVNAVDFCGRFTLADSVRHRPPESYFGGEWAPDISTRGGVLSALDVTTGSIRWQYRTHRGLIAGIAVSDSTVYTGDLDGNLLVFDARTGAIVRRTPLGAPIGGGVLAYRVGNRRYLAMAVGRVSAQLPVNDGGPATVLVIEAPGRTR